MKVLTYKELDNDESYSLAFEMREKILPILEQKYKNPMAELKLTFTAFGLAAILSALNGKLEGKRILDIGCGSTTTYDDFSGKRLFEPWLCRTLLELGAKPIGVDIEPKNGEKFEYFQADLIKNSLNFLEPNSIDIVHASAFFDSTRLLNGLKNKGIDFHQFSRSLREKLEKAVKHEGIFIHDFYENPF